MNLSFVIPAFNEENNIERTISSIHRAMCARGIAYEVIVGDHQSADNTAKVARENGARVVEILRGGTVANVRNQAVKMASGDILVFLDADIELDASWGDKFTEVLKLIEINPRQLLGSLCIPPQIDNYIVNNWFDKLTRKQTGYLGTAHMIIATEQFNRVGGFDATLKTGEDYEFCGRCRSSGIELNVMPELVVYHHDYPMTFGRFIARESWHGMGDFQSLSNMLNSKVALTALMFLAIHLGIAAGLLFGTWFYTALCVILLLVFLWGILGVKFKDVGIKTKVKMLPIVYSYYLGRSASLFKSIFAK